MVQFHGANRTNGAATSPKSPMTLTSSHDAKEQPPVLKPKMLYIPDTMRAWPWPAALNPHYEQADAESVAWRRKFSDFTRQLTWHDRVENTPVGVYPLEEPVLVLCPDTLSCSKVN